MRNNQICQRKSLVYYTLVQGINNLKVFPKIFQKMPKLPKSGWRIGLDKILTYDTSISYLFYECSSLKELPECSALKILPDISKWNTNSVNNMSNLFNGCSSLEYLPDISKWNAKKYELFILWMLIIKRISRYF